jgi:hypothetical protein
VRRPFSVCFLSGFFKNDTVQCRCSQHARTLTPMNTRTQILPYGRSGASRSHLWHLVVDGNVAYHLTHNTGKSWKIQEKVRTPEFEP